MESHEQNHIRKHLIEILQNSSCNTQLLAYLESNNMLSANDLDLLKSIPTNLDKMSCLLNILKTRTGAYSRLISAFAMTAQTGVVSILESIYHKKDIAHNAQRLLTNNQPTGTDNSSVSWPQKCFGVRPPDSLFTGREKELDEMHAYLSLSENSGILTLAGLGGIGKTQLAKKYIANYKTCYKFIFWINAELTCSIQSTFCKIAIELNIATVNSYGEDRETESVLGDVYARIATGKSLIVFDNAELANHMSLYLPTQYLSSNTVKIINTSRDQDWSRYGKSIVVQGFSQEDAIQYVKLGLSITDNSQNETIIQLVQKLHFFPLALSQSVSYIRETSSMKTFDIAAYLTEFDLNTTKLLKFSALFEKRIYDDYEKTTFTTWHVTLEKVKSYKTIGHLSEIILKYCSYLLPENIETAIFLAMPNQAEDCIQASLRLLVKYSLLMTEDKQRHVSIHRMVQEVIKLEEKENGFEARNLCDVLDMLIKAQTHAKNHQALLGHQVFVFSLGAWESNFLSRHKGMPACLVRRLVRTFKRIEAVELGLEWKTAIIQLLKGTPEVCSGLEYEIAIACLKAGKFAAAINHMKMALEGFAKLGEISGTRYLEGQRVIARALMKLGNHKEALDILFEITKSYDSFDSKIAKESYGKLLLDIGTCQRNLGKYDKVLDSYLDALEIFKEINSEELINHTHISIANFHGSMGRNNNAVQVLQKLHERYSNKQCPNRISADYSLALYLCRLSQFDQAHFYCENALRESETSLGKLHPRTITCKALLASIYEGKSNVEKSKHLKELVYHEFSEVLGDKHFKTQLAKAYFAASWVSSEMDNLAEAEYAMSGALQELKKTDVSRDYAFFHLQIEFVRILKLQNKFEECKIYLSSMKSDIENLHNFNFDEQFIDQMLKEIDESQLSKFKKLKISPQAGSLDF